MTPDELLVESDEALMVGRWEDARRSFELALTEADSAPACFGLAAALWWTGHNREAVSCCTRAYALFRRAGDVDHAVQCAVWLAITYKANFANTSAANGWTRRAERLLDGLDAGPLHGWTWLARAYRSLDLDNAEDLTQRAVAIAASARDVDLELVALSQLGLIRVGKGDVSGGFALIDEALAATLGGERTSLDTVVYTCCDMLNACELANDLGRAGQWCEVADEFVSTYGCPFLYAECRIFYGSVLTARGRWADAERELAVGLRITEGASPGLHARARTRLAALRVRQGRLEDAEHLLAGVAGVGDVEPDRVIGLAALLVARRDPAGAVRQLRKHLDRIGQPVAHTATALGLLVEATLATGDVAAATAALERLGQVADATRSEHVVAMTSHARGQVAAAGGDVNAVQHLELALGAWVAMDLPYEAARTRGDLARLLAADHPDIAIDHARSALASFEALGATLDADRVAALLRSLGMVPRVGAKGVGPLTQREQEVLRLVAAGLSNPQIAERLHVSRRTASHHVSNILSKLQLRTRAAAAAHAASVLGSGDEWVS